MQLESQYIEDLEFIYYFEFLKFHLLFQFRTQPFHFLSVWSFLIFNQPLLNNASSKFNNISLFTNYFTSIEL